MSFLCCVLQVAQRFDCLAVTLEMPFKDTADFPDAVQVGGWGRVEPASGLTELFCDRGLNALPMHVGSCLRRSPTTYSLVLSGLADTVALMSWFADTVAHPALPCLNLLQPPATSLVSCTMVVT